MMTPADDPDAADFRRFMEDQLKFLTVTFEQAKTYANLFILAGYGSFFALWNATKDRLYSTPRLAIGAALLMLVSVTVFILWHVWSVFLLSRSQQSLAKVLMDPAAISFETIQATMDAHIAAERKRVPLLVRAWYVLYPLTVVSGLSAIGLLGWTFVRALWSCPVPYACG